MRVDVRLVIGSWYLLCYFPTFLPKGYRYKVCAASLHSFRKATDTSTVLPSDMLSDKVWFCATSRHSFLKKLPMTRHDNTTTRQSFQAVQTPCQCAQGQNKPEGFPHSNLAAVHQSCHMISSRLLKFEWVSTLIPHIGHWLLRNRCQVSLDSI